MEQVDHQPVRNRRSNNQIKQLLEQFETSNCSVTDFCKQHGISTKSFHRWKSRFSGKSVGKKNQPGFAPLDVVSWPSGLPGLFAEVKGIRLYQPVSASFLKELL